MTKAWTRDLRTVAWLDQEDARTAEAVARHGWQVIHVGSCGCDRCDPEEAQRARTAPGRTEDGSFSYTIGLTALSHPELLVEGLSARVAQEVLNVVGVRVRDGLVLRSDDDVLLPCWPHRLRADRHPDPGRFVLGANRHYGRTRRTSVPVITLCW